MESELLSVWNLCDQFEHFPCPSRDEGLSS